MVRKNRLSDKSFRCLNLDGKVVTVKPHFKVIVGSRHRKISFRNRFIVDSESIRCPVRWRCKRLNRIIEVSEDAVFNSEFGFLCDCSTGIVCNCCGNSDYSGYGVHLICNVCGSGKNGSRNDFSGNCVWVKGADAFHDKVFFGRRLAYFPNHDVVDIIGHEDKHISPLVEDYYAVEAITPSVDMTRCCICHNLYPVKNVHSILGQNICISCYPDSVKYEDIKD